MDYVFPPADPVSLPVTGTDKQFPVRRIYCIGRNYSDHVREMGGDVKHSQPIIFTKSSQAIVPSGALIPFPPNTQNLHYEVELVVAMGPSGIYGYGVGIDLTRRDIQSTMKERGQPWDRAKNFTRSAPCSAITQADEVDISHAHIVLRKNGDIVQSSSIDKMIWSIDEIIDHISDDMDLQAGDLIFTGTPEGVGPVTVGDQLAGDVEGLAQINVHFVSGQPHAKSAPMSKLGQLTAGLKKHFTRAMRKS